jgi:hypothetical protein
MWSAKGHKQIGKETSSEKLMVGAHLECMLGVWHPHRLSSECGRVVRLSAVCGVPLSPQYLRKSPAHSAAVSHLPPFYHLHVTVQTNVSQSYYPARSPSSLCSFLRTSFVLTYVSCSGYSQRIIECLSSLFPSHLFNASLPLRFTLAVFPAQPITRQTMVSRSKYS